MDINIRKAVIDNLKNSNPDDILSVINDSMNVKEDKILPGLGVLFEVYWKKIDDTTKRSIASTIANNVK